MKKVIVAAAGLMLVGTMATTAMAEFKFSGDARARFYYENNYNSSAVLPSYRTDDDSASLWNSRVRFKIEADTKGGAYVKTRVRLSEGTWDGTSETRAKGEGTNFYTDYAYIGVPFGPVAVEGGLVVRDVTPFFFFDGRADAIQVRYKSDQTGLVAFWGVLKETDFNDGTTTIDVDADALTATTITDDDEDSILAGALLNQAFDGGWGLTVGALYASRGETSTSTDSLDLNTGVITNTTGTIADEDGFGATVHVDGAIGSVAIAAELAFQQEEFRRVLFGSNVTDDDGFGGYISATVPVGSVEVLGMAGFTADGFTMDAADFGPFIILQDYSQISIGTNFSTIGESMFVAIAPTFKATEQLTLGAQASYVNVDPYAAGADDRDLFEIGATASYAVTDGAKLNGIIGYADVDTDNDDDNPFGIGLSLEISF